MSTQYPSREAYEYDPNGTTLTLLQRQEKGSPEDLYKGEISPIGGTDGPFGDSTSSSDLTGTFEIDVSAAEDPFFTEAVPKQRY